MTLDLSNALIESLTYIPFIADIRRSIIDKSIKGSSVWMMLGWLCYSTWCGFVSKRVGLPVTALVIVVGVALYAVRVALAFYYTFFEIPNITFSLDL